MKHLEFSEKIDALGISIRSTKTEGGIKTISVAYGLGDRCVLVEGFNVTYADKSAGYESKTAFKAIVEKAIDMDSWKHSWHLPVVEENFEKIKDIIQQKIIDRASEIEELLTVYFQINYEQSCVD